ncbi:hypothetical protein GBW32_29320 [Streptomyces tsukubensis]|uniref:Uncharacterized protein n=3 Tax=Streptomyces tsukubensis TaxID=83656 RepID=A0A1V4ADF6_9ACTN|nr:hypothetical protein B1H18_05480 [Streptomyces tsukubensis]QFR96390.1 hypothetical protein GBW32_29320 [Streptomyces tsukubensis]
MMTVASRGKQPRATGNTENGVLPVDVETISVSTNMVLAMQMATSTRQEMDGSTSVILGHLNRLLVEDLGTAEDEGVQELLHRGRKLVDYTSRPTAETTSFGAFIYLRDSAHLTRQLLWIYTQHNGLGAP